MQTEVDRVDRSIAEYFLLMTVQLLIINKTIQGIFELIQHDHRNRIIDRQQIE